jgi:hypothetical protein
MPDPHRILCFAYACLGGEDVTVCGSQRGISTHLAVLLHDSGSSCARQQAQTEAPTRSSLCAPRARAAAAPLCSGCMRPPLATSARLKTAERDYLFVQQLLPKRRPEAGVALARPLYTRSSQAAARACSDPSLSRVCQAPRRPAACACRWRSSRSPQQPGQGGRGCSGAPFCVLTCVPGTARGPLLCNKRCLQTHTWSPPRRLRAAACPTAAARR